jgi:transposase-like protein
MRWILSDVPTLKQYLSLFLQGIFLPDAARCPHCSRAGLWRHGCYDRKADRLSPAGESLNPVPIQRFLCRICRRTCSVLPECLPPRRWYLWAVQQVALEQLLSGASLRVVARAIAPSRHTLRRWWQRFKEQFHLHKDALCHHFAALGRTNGFAPFWQACFTVIPLCSAMRLCHVSGVAIP